MSSMSHPDGTLSFEQALPAAKEDNLDLSLPTPTDSSPKGLDGGLVAWTQCAGSFFLFFNGWGIVNTFGPWVQTLTGWVNRSRMNLLGVYQTFYERNLLSHESFSNISWIGSLQAFLLIFGGVVTGPLFDRGYLRTLIVTGSFLVVFGMMMASLCAQYWQVLLAQGLLVGLGNGSFFLPSITLLPMYFTTKRALVQGIAASGSSLGRCATRLISTDFNPWQEGLFIRSCSDSCNHG